MPVRLSGPVLTRGLLTGLEAPLLQLDVPGRFEQRVEQAHDAAARGTSAPAVTPRLATRHPARSRGRRHRRPIAARRARHVAAANGQWERTPVT